MGKKEPIKKTNAGWINTILCSQSVCIVRLKGVCNDVHRSYTTDHAILAVK